MKSRVVIIGPAYPLRGGLASFDQRLAKEFADSEYDCCIYSFSLQYPEFLFPGTTQYSTDPPPEDIRIHTRINSINPLNWLIVGNELKKLKADIVVVRYWLPLMGPALGTILRVLKANRFSRVIAITDNILPHEKRLGDKSFTRYFLEACDAFITMSSKVMSDLRLFEQTKPAIQVLHPLYDNFGEPVSKTEARRYIEQKTGVTIKDGDKVLLFFGFIRKYKGLDILIDAMAEPAIRESGIRLLIAGEFYEDRAGYIERIRELTLADSLILQTDFIPDAEVKYYLCAADAVVQPYRNATQSGVTPLAYHFEKPMIVSNVGGLPALVPHGKSGLVCEPNSASLAATILEFYKLGDAYFIPHLRIEKLKYSWQNLLKAITELYHDLQK